MNTQNYSQGPTWGRSPNGSITNRLRPAASPSTDDAPAGGSFMKFRVERDALADAVAWAARSLSARPTIPVLAGLLLTVEGTTLSVSGFDLEASTQIELDVTGASDGATLVS